MVAEKTLIISAEQEAQLRQPIDEYVGNIQAKLNALREDGTNKVLDIQATLETLKRDKIYTPQERPRGERRSRLSSTRPRKWRAGTRLKCPPWWPRPRAI